MEIGQDAMVTISTLIERARDTGFPIVSVQYPYEHLVKFWYRGSGASSGDRTSGACVHPIPDQCRFTRSYDATPVDDAHGSRANGRVHLGWWQPDEAVGSRGLPLMNQVSWEDRTEWPLAGTAVLFLVAYSVQVIVQPEGFWAAALSRLMWIVWAVFLVDYAARLYLAEHSKRWFILNFHELLIVALPMLRPLRLLRLLSLRRAFHRVGGHALRGRLVMYVVGSAAILSYAAALAVLDVERGSPDANITTIGDALWWAMTTITTVGYGDQFPVTTAGRLIAASLMIGGIAVLGVVTATLASWLVESVTAETAAEVGTCDSAILRELAEVKDQLQLLTERDRLQCRDETPN